MRKQDNGKLCFVIAPIGEEGSEVRRRSDQLLKHLITLAAAECGYETIRADKISEPGIITSQVIQHLVDDPLVVADLTGHNPNVFYELAIRHAVRKPVVQLIELGESIPFDVAQSRTIRVDHRDLDSVADCREELIRQVRSVERDPSDVDTPISVAIDLQSLRQSENPLEKGSAEIIAMLLDLRSRVDELREMRGAARIDPSVVNDLVIGLDYLSTRVALREDQEPTRAMFQEVVEGVELLQRTVFRLTAELGIGGRLLESMTERRVRRGRPGLVRRAPNGSVQ